MLIGHYGASLAAKKLYPTIPLWLLCLATQFVDIVWTLLVLFRVERANLEPSLLSVPLDLEFMPYSHSLLASGAWALLAMLLCLAMRIQDLKGALVIAAVVLSHWFLDLIVHRPDLTLAGGSPKLGLSLWNYPAAAVAIELSLLVGAFFWLRAFKRPSWVRHPAMYFGVGLLALMAAVIGLGWLPAPDSLSSIIAFQLTLYILVPIGVWWLEKKSLHHGSTTSGIAGE